MKPNTRGQTIRLSNPKAEGDLPCSNAREESSFLLFGAEIHNRRNANGIATSESPVDAAVPLFHISSVPYCLYLSIDVQLGRSRHSQSAYAKYPTPRMGYPRATAHSAALWSNPGIPVQHVSSRPTFHPVSFITSTPMLALRKLLYPSSIGLEIEKGKPGARASAGTFPADSHSNAFGMISSSMYFLTAARSFR